MCLPQLLMLLSPAHFANSASSHLASYQSITSPAAAAAAGQVARRLDSSRVTANSLRLRALVAQAT